MKSPGDHVIVIGWLFFAVFVGAAIVNQTETILFCSAFTTVFLLGFQQQNVIHRHYFAAVIVSLGIGASQIFLWKNIPGADLSQIVATLAGGPVGIVSAMWLHPKIMQRRPI